MNLAHTLQRMAGKDPYCLDRASYSERVMCIALGAISVLIGWLALMSIGQAMFMVYFPDGFDRSVRHILNASFLAFFSLAWMMIIFNFYRFALSTAFTYKNHSLRSVLPRMVIQIFLGVLIGLSISLPLSVVLGHQELKENTTIRQETLISNIYKTIDTKNEDALFALYAELTQKLQTQIGAQARLQTYLKNQSSPEFEAVNSAAQETSESVTQTQEKILALRQKIATEKQAVEATIHAHDGLMTNIKKAVEKNKIMVFLMSIFICMTLTATTLFEAFFSPGLYEYLVEYNNHVTLASHGITTESKKIFIDSQAFAQPQYALPEELLREQKIQLAHGSKLDMDKLNHRP